MKSHEYEYDDMSHLTRLTIIISFVRLSANFACVLISRFLDRYRTFPLRLHYLTSVGTL